MAVASSLFAEKRGLSPTAEPHHVYFYRRKERRYSKNGFNTFLEVGVCASHPLITRGRLFALFMCIVYCLFRLAISFRTFTPSYAIPSYFAYSFSLLVEIFTFASHFIPCPAVFAPALPSSRVHVRLCASRAFLRRPACRPLYESRPFNHRVSPNID